MLSQTSIIVLNYTKYSDSSIIVHGLSEHHGRISFMVYGIGSKNRSKLTNFQPLYLLDAQLYFKANRSIQKIKEFKLAPPLYNLINDIRKSTLALFISELLSKIIQEEYTDKQLFDFIKTSILLLNEIESNVSIFHLVFLLKLSKYIGFAPYQNMTNANYFDYKEGNLVQVKPPHQNFIGIDKYKQIINLLNANFSNLNAFKLSRSDRDNILDTILKMYEIHILNFTSLKSYRILKEVFSK